MEFATRHVEGKEKHVEGENTIPTVKHSGDSVMLRGGFFPPAWTLEQVSFWGDG